MPGSRKRDLRPPGGPGRAWYRQFWPWFIIALPAAAVIASFFTLWLAASRPDPLVLDGDAYRRLESELRVQAGGQEAGYKQAENPEEAAGG